MKKRSFLKIKKDDQSGQGALEYILVLVVTVGLIVGLLAQFNRSVEVWLNNYFGDYLACLLETGELPALGKTESSGVCAAYHTPFVGSTEPTDGGAGGDGGDGGGGESGGDNNTPKSSKSSSSKGAADSASNRGGINSNSGSSGSGKFGRNSKFRMGGSGAGKSSSGGDKDELSNTGSTEVSTPDGLGDSNRGPSVIRMKTNNLNLGFGIRRDNDETREEKFTVSKAKNDLKKEKRDERFPAAKPPKGQLKDSNTDLEIGYGDYLRYLLIAAIIIAIIVFFGGQVIQLSKSSD